MSVQGTGNKLRQSTRLFLASLKVIFRNVKQSFVEVPAAALACILFFRKKDTHYIIICDHIGDFILTMGYLKAFREQKCVQHLTVCVADKFEPLLRAYDGTHSFDSAMVFRPHKIQLILRLGSTNFGTHILHKLPHITMVNPADAFTADGFEAILQYPGITLKECILYGCLKLPSDAAFFPPDIKRENARFLIEGYCKNKVLLCPFSRATRKIPWQLFTDLAEKLQEKGYIVYTNLSDSKHRPIEGTKGIRCSLTEALHMVDSSWYVIGARSGLMDLLAYTSCKIIALYSHDEPCFDFFQLKALPETKAKTTELKLTDSIRKNINHILLQMEEPT